MREELETASRFQTLFENAEFSSDGAVCRLRTSGGSVVYRIQARVLPFLIGSVYLIGENDKNGKVAVSSAPSEYLLIDAGSGTSESNADLETAFRTIREEFEPTFAPEKIARILLTHSHIDHFGGAFELRKRGGAEIWAHSFESCLIADYDSCAFVENRRYAAFLREAGATEDEIPQILTGFGFVPGRAKSAPVARTLFGGEKIGKIRTFYLPGHSPGHLAFLLDDVIFTGDLVLSKTLTQIWPSRTTPRTGLFNYLDSLRKLSEIAENFETARGRKLVALPGHEEPIFDVPSRVSQAFRATDRRNRRLLNILSASDEPATLFEIARRMYWSGRPNREFFALSDVGSRVEFLEQLGFLRVANAAELSDAAPALRYAPLFSDAKLAEDSIQQILRMNFAGYQPEPVERDANFGRD